MSESLQAQSSAWEADEYVVSIRDTAIDPVWGDHPVGPTVSRSAGATIARWLNDGGLREILNRYGKTRAQ